jgi:serine/threonine-protein kinase
MEGTIIDGKYEVLRQLGAGGMGAVYQARHRTTGRKVAVKVIVPAALAGGVDIIARFQREARASGSIDSPFVVQVLDAGLDPATGAPYMVMECLAGEDVQGAVTRLGPLSSDVLLRITAHACHGLNKAHEAGIVHRDIKSANLFLARREGDTSEIITKILDFGIAKVRANPLPGEDHKLTKTGSMLGSPVYMSPEQAIGAKDLDARSDIFSMGVMMYEALSGATPNGHLENLGALLMAICSQQAQSIQDRAPWVTADVAAIVHKALALKPEDRYQSAAELRAATVALLPGGGTTLLESMLVPLSPEARACRAPRLAPAKPSAAAFAETALPSPISTTQLLPGTGTNPATGSNPAIAAGAATGPVPGMSTTAGLGVSEASSSGTVRPFRWAALVGVIAGVTVLGGGGGGLYYARQRAQHAPEKTFGLAAVESPSASAPAPARDVARTETVAVSPEGATVEVGGKSVTVTGGHFDVTGAVGSVHDVRVRLGSVEKRFDVVISSSGPRPDRVEITAPRPQAAQPASPGAQARPPTAAKLGAAPVQQPTTQPVAPPPAVVPPRPTPAAPTPPPTRQPAGPTIDRNDP